MKIEDKIPDNMLDKLNFARHDESRSQRTSSFGPNIIREGFNSSWGGFWVFTENGVDKAVLSFDKDHSARKSLMALAESLGDTYSLAFANIGDQDNVSIPEVESCESQNISVIDVMGAKVQSSS